MEKRYTRFGKVAHLVSRNIYQESIWMSPCGFSGSDYNWLGTGSQEEYETAEKLPLCKTCERLTK
jgi:hypothetical protein